MYRSKYRFKPARDRHEVIETIESTIHKHLQKLEPEIPTLLVCELAGTSSTRRRRNVACGIHAKTRRPGRAETHDG